MNFLRICIYAPLTSWGDIAVGEERGSLGVPSRSAVLGLVAASLGIIREDQDSHDALDAAIRVAVRIEVTGTRLSEYQTAQTASASFVKNHRPRTRRELLRAQSLETILSRRQLIQDSCYTIVIWIKGVTNWTLADIAAALKRPSFVLYAGRKANVLGWPLDPEIIEATSLAAAFTHPLTKEKEGLRDTTLGPIRPPLGWGLHVEHDRCEEFESGLIHERTIVRRDATPHRLRWQFSERNVIVGALPRGET